MCFSGLLILRYTRCTESSMPIPITTATIPIRAGEKLIEVTLIKANVRGIAPKRGNTAKNRIRNFLKKIKSIMAIILPAHKLIEIKSLLIILLTDW